MGKLIMLLCFTLLAMTLVMACSGPGMICTNDDDCCGAFGCNPWAGRCTGRPGMGPGGPWGPARVGPASTEVE